MIRSPEFPPFLLAVPMPSTASPPWKTTLISSAATPHSGCILKKIWTEMGQGRAVRIMISHRRRMLVIVFGCMSLRYASVLVAGRMIGPTVRTLIRGRRLAVVIPGSTVTPAQRVRSFVRETVRKETAVSLLTVFSSAGSTHTATVPSRVRTA